MLQGLGSADVALSDGDRTQVGESGCIGEVSRGVLEIPCPAEDFRKAGLETGISINPTKSFRLDVPFLGGHQCGEMCCLNLIETIEENIGTENKIKKVPGT